MGFIREQFGRITVESRRESFMIHVEDASLREPSSEWWTDDLDDLIAALVDYRASLGRVSGGGSGVDTPPPNPYQPSPDDEPWQRAVKGALHDAFAAGLAAVRSWLRDEIYDPADGNGGTMTVSRWCRTGGSGDE